MMQCVGCLGTIDKSKPIHDRRTLFHNITVGDIFHAAAPNGRSLICLTTSVTEKTIQARTVTHQMHLEFDREVGIAEWIGALDWPDLGMSDKPVRCTIDSVAPLPVDIHNVMLFIDRKSRLNNDWAQVKLSEAEINALLFVSSFYRANSLP